MKKHIFIWLFCMFVCYFCLYNTTFSQTLVNNGGNIVIREGAYLVIGGDYINKSYGAIDGKINLDGNIILKRNWVNLANNEVLVSIGAGTVGHVILNGTSKQYIEGTNPTIFENLILDNYKKILKVADCKINDTLTVNAQLLLNANNIRILNRFPSAIQYKSGCIISETNTNEGLGLVDWYIGSEVNGYTVPFGSGFDNTADLEVTVVTKTAASPDNGMIRFGTYPTPCQNVPFPPGVNELDRSYEYIADRFWYINPVYYQTKPDVGIILKYTPQDINESCNAGIVEIEMKAIRHNTLQHTWSDMPPHGNINTDEHKVYIDSISADDFYAPWCLVEEVVNWEIYFPSAFTPNGDGLNEFFVPIGMNLDKLKLNMFIYNRWGNLVYIMDDINKPWDGRTGNSDKICPEGVYAWILFLTDKEGMEYNYKGVVTLIQ